MTYEIFEMIAVTILLLGYYQALILFLLLFFWLYFERWYS